MKNEEQKPDGWIKHIIKSPFIWAAPLGLFLGYIMVYGPIYHSEQAKENRETLARWMFANPLIITHALDDQTYHWLLANPQLLTEITQHMLDGTLDQLQQSELFQEKVRNSKYPHQRR